MLRNGAGDTVARKLAHLAGYYSRTLVGVPVGAMRESAVPRPHRPRPQPAREARA